MARLGLVLALGALGLLVLAVMWPRSVAKAGIPVSQGWFFPAVATLGVAGLILWRRFREADVPLHQRLSGWDAAPTAGRAPSSCAASPRSGIQDSRHRSPLFMEHWTVGGEWNARRRLGVAIGVVIILVGVAFGVTGIRDGYGGVWHAAVFILAGVAVVRGAARGTERTVIGQPEADLGAELARRRGWFYLKPWEGRGQWHICERGMRFLAQVRHCGRLAFLQYGHQFDAHLPFENVEGFRHKGKAKLTVYFFDFGGNWPVEFSVNRLDDTPERTLDILNSRIAADGATRE